MKLDNFFEFDEFHVIFPKYQDEKIKIIGDLITKALSPDAKIIRKATFKYKKLSLKDKDILYVILRNSIKGIFGLMLFLYEFEDLIEIRGVKNIKKFEIPKDIRDFFEDNYEIFEQFNKDLEKNKNSRILKLKDINSKVVLQIKNLINRSV